MTSLSFSYHTLAFKPLMCGLFYRWPSSNNSVLTDLEDHLDSLPSRQTSNPVILGDFNIDAAHNTSNPMLSIQAK